MDFVPRMIRRSLHEIRLTHFCLRARLILTKILYAISAPNGTVTPRCILLFWRPVLHFARVCLGFWCVHESGIPPLGSSHRSGMVRGPVWGRHRTAGTGLAAHPRRENHADLRAHRIGKTLAAFLACIDRLIRKALAGELIDATQVLYVSPLKPLATTFARIWSSRWVKSSTWRPRAGF